MIAVSMTNDICSRLIDGELKRIDDFVRDAIFPAHTYDEISQLAKIIDMGRNL